MSSGTSENPFNDDYEEPKQSEDQVLSTALAKYLSFKKAQQDDLLLPSTDLPSKNLYPQIPNTSITLVYDASTFPFQTYSRTFSQMKNSVFAQTTRVKR